MKFKYATVEDEKGKWLRPALRSFLFHRTATLPQPPPQRWKTTLSV
jgi:hypothetical protein